MSKAEHVIGEVPIENKFYQMKDIAFVLITIVLGNVGHDFEEFAIWRLYLDKVSVEDLGTRPRLGRHEFFKILVHNFPSVFNVVHPTGKFNFGQI